MRHLRHLTWENVLVELRGLEPLTFCMPCSTIPSEGVALGLVPALQRGFDVWGSLARSGEICGRWSLVWSWFADFLQSMEGGCAPAPRRAGTCYAVKMGLIVEIMS